MVLEKYIEILVTSYKKNVLVYVYIYIYIRCGSEKKHLVGYFRDKENDQAAKRIFPKEW